MILGAIGVNGDAASDFTPISGCVSPLAGGDACVIDVIFKPTAGGDRAAALTIADNAQGAPQIVPLDGTGAALASVSVTPSVADFGNVPLAGPAAHRAITVTNTGNTPVAVTGASLSLVPSSVNGLIHTVAGGGAATGDGVVATAADLDGIVDVALGANGDMFVADPAHHRIRRIDVVTGLVSTVAGNGSPGYAGDGGPADHAVLDQPSAVTIDRAGNLYVSDTANHVVRKIDAAGVITTVAGTGTPGYTGDGGAATSAALHAPRGLFVDLAGALWVADSLNHAIRRIGPDGVISTELGTGVQGSGDGSSGPVTLNAPAGVVVDPAGTIMVVDTGNNRVVSRDRDGGVHVVTADATAGLPLLGPSAIVRDALGRVYIADTLNNRVLQLDVSTLSAATPFAGAGQSGFTDDRSALSALLSRPRGMAADLAGNLFVVDEGNGRLRRVEAAFVGTPEFTIDAGACAAGLAPSASCDIDVAFLPAEANARVAQMTVADDSGGAQHVVTLVGRGTTPIADVPVPLYVWTSFGSTETRRVPLVNSGNDTLHVSGVSASGGAGVWSATDDCGADLAPGASCGIDLSFAPTSPGELSGTLTIAHDGMPNPHVIQLRGSGVPSTTSTTLTSAPADRSVFGAPVTLSVSVSTSFQTATGLVALFDPQSGTRSLQLDATGAASTTTAALVAGHHVFQAAYGGDAVHAASSAPTLDLTIDPQPTTTSLTVSAASAIYGQAVTLTSSVTSPTSGPLTGTIQFLDGATPVGTVAVAGGGATLTLTNLAAGAHTVTAAYSGDANSVASVSPPATVAIMPATTTALVAVSSDPAYVNHPVTITAAISPQFTGQPTGDVSFFGQGRRLLGTAPIVAGQAVLTTTFGSSQNVTVTAVYAGDGNFTGSTSNPVSFRVRQAQTTMTLTTSLTPSFVGQAVTFTVTLTSAIGPPPDGAAITLNGAAPTAQHLSLTNGVATYTTSTLTAGGHGIWASYAGDRTFTGASKSLSQVVKKYQTTIAVTSNANPSTFGDAVTFTATVTSSGGPPPQDGELVTFWIAGTTAHAAITGGVARLTTLTLQGGTRSVLASYPGDAAFGPSTSAVLIQTVRAAPTVVTLVTSAAQPTRNAPVTFTVTVTSAPGTPTGSVTLKVNGSGVATQSLANGVATLTYRFNRSGTYSVTATYSGSTNFAAATSAPVTESVP